MTLTSEELAVVKWFGVILLALFAAAIFLGR